MSEARPNLIFVGGKEPGYTDPILLTFIEYANKRGFATRQAKLKGAPHNAANGDARVSYDALQLVLSDRDAFPIASKQHPSKSKFRDYFIHSGNFRPLTERLMEFTRGDILYLGGICDAHDELDGFDEVLRSYLDAPNCTVITVCDGYKGLDALLDRSDVARLTCPYNAAIPGCENEAVDALMRTYVTHTPAVGHIRGSI